MTKCFEAASYPIFLSISTYVSFFLFYMNILFVIGMLAICDTAALTLIAQTEV